MESDKLKKLLFPKKMDNAHLLVNTAAFCDPSKNRKIISGLVELKDRLQRNLNYNNDSKKIDDAKMDSYQKGPSAFRGYGRTSEDQLEKYLRDDNDGSQALKNEPQAFQELCSLENSLENKVALLLVSTLDCLPLKDIERIYEDIAQDMPADHKGDDHELLALSDFLMVINSLRWNEQEGALAYFSNIEQKSFSRGVRFVRALAASSLVSNYLSEMELDKAGDLFSKMDKRDEFGASFSPGLSLVESSSKDSTDNLHKKIKIVKPRLTLLKAKNQRDLSLLGSIMRLLDTTDPEEIRMRVARNLIFFSAYQGALAFGEEIWRGLYTEPGFANSLKELPFHKIMAYATGLSGDARKAFFHLNIYAKSAEPLELPMVRAKVFVALIYSQERARDTERIITFCKDLWAIPDPNNHSIVNIKARGATLLVKHFSQAKNFVQVKEVFKKIDMVFLSKDIISEAFRATTELIVTYASIGELSVAINLFQHLERLEGIEEFNFQRILASVAIVDALARAGKLREARELYFYQRALKAPGEGSSLTDGLDLCFSQIDLESAMEEDLFRLETGQIYSSHILVKRAKVAVTLMDAFRERGDIRSVFSIYDTFDCSGDPKVLSFLRMGLMMSLFLGEVPKASRLSKAENISQGIGFKPKLVPNSNQDSKFNLEPNFKLDSKFNQNPNSKLVSNSKLDLPLGETIPQRNQEQEFLKGILLNLRFSKNKPDCNLTPTTNEPKCFKTDKIIHKVNLGLVNDALNLYFSEDYQETSSKDPKLRARAALAIGLRLSDDSDYQNLIRLYNTGVFKNLGENDLPDGALVLVRLLNHFCETGEIKLARELFLEFPKLEGSAGITILRTAAAIILTQATMLGKDTLGMELMVDYFLKLTPLEMRVLKSYRFKLQERYRELKKEKNID